MDIAKAVGRSLASPSDADGAASFASPSDCDRHVSSLSSSDTDESGPSQSASGSPCRCSVSRCQPVYVGALCPVLHAHARPCSLPVMLSTWTRDTAVALIVLEIEVVIFDPTKDESTAVFPVGIAVPESISSITLSASGGDLTAAGLRLGPPYHDASVDA
ncbi:hypothetical protein TGPRC2_287240 [Toxoplasma gondii TgCatPRC2]|uniref:Uncharacterized protein n=8 Tax=Toxoplasma gondii TaxID=5811 RepID=S7UP24_TOXGG|nr:hypothetical protein TGGT1_287240 [Toxoplasma gondii GT1]KAF4643770.1 hypothetical protein TGRH88_025250 [Toxoplasma gondii]KFG54861.1 hypothetical protein TGFOU_287240 [Toxoplasma gondii FOU]KFG63182.1 hypothetical protein TGRUB_287240 [Toxoplasma gondii RUB]KFH08508.1 hypothetical protein TGVAND_287240 [Toxoplasma gondii VAND]KYK68840.1 hypothetical protein TGPRC2_287240 [Toxoplasma gondii TgCatPRC2]PUA86167.1 hypothetical protein TGBR9_287240 [Toxoplasma gondii TgCATBr9]RQX69697.1 hypo